MCRLVSVKSFSQILVDCGTYDFLEDPSNGSSFVLSSLLYIMNLKLPIKNVPATTILFSEKMKSPICLRESGLIILNANPSNWSQVAYQLAHEMCHRTIPSEVSQNLRWLEESICELSSYYFLPRLSKYWRRQKVNFVLEKSGLPYYPAFEKYVKNDIEKAIAIDLSSFSAVPPSNELHSLIKDCEIREKNAYIAKILLPIFDKHPDTWHAIPLLGILSPNIPLKASLTEWIELSPVECHVGLKKIAEIFGVKPSQQ